MEIEELASGISDDSVLTDLELGIRKIHIGRPTAEKPINDTLLSTVLPPFTRLQRLTTQNVQNRTSLIGVVASVTDRTILYSPIPETGAITSVHTDGVTLSFLNVNSGILEEQRYPETRSRCTSIDFYSTSAT